MSIHVARLVCLTATIILSLLSVVANAAPIQKRPKPVWQGYGFLPGYRQPLSNSIPLYGHKDAMRRLSRADRRHWYIDPVHQYYGWDGEWHYFGRPGFRRRPLQWRRFRALLDADADRADLELRVIGRRG